MPNLLRTIQLALKSLMLHKLRSGLTMLGIVFGVFSVIAMLAIGEGASQQAQQQVLQLGATNIIVRSVKPPRENASAQNQNSFVLRYGIKRADFDLLSKTIPTVLQAVPIRELTKACRYLHREMNCRIVGCTPEYVDMNHLALAQGRFISDKDRREKTNVCVLAAGTAEQLFQYADPLGQSVKIADRRYTVVGVTRRREASAAIGGSMSGQEYNQDIYIPLETMRVRMGDLDIDRRQGSFSAEEVELNQITLRITDVDQVVPTADVIRESLEQNHRNANDYSIVVPQELLKQAAQIRTIFNVVLGSIAAISLVVGGIGIMNIMLATVTERTREIGIRRALGAKRHDITMQFLTETIVLAGSGGIIGVLLGLSTPFWFANLKSLTQRFFFSSGGGGASEFSEMFTNLSPQVVPSSLPLAFGISVGIGVIFGLYPARSAAQLDPIEALRHE
ncbi:MAG: Macrolide export ATP-binding/permease protein MacB [Planctomycetota bacterium]|jgi:putative ABC transport system permease protein